MSANSVTLTLPLAMQRAVSAYQSGHFSEAARLCELILNADPKHLDAINLSGALCVQRGDPAAALKCFSRAVEMRPDFAEGFNNRGVVLQELERWDEALESYQRALGIAPDYIDALYNRGVVLGELKRWDEALESYQRALDLRPDNARAHNNRGNVLQKLKRWDEALESYQRALDLRPDHAEAFNNRGVVLRELKRWDEALQSYQRAVELRPDYADAFNNRAVALNELNRWEEALQSCERALEIRPGYAEAFNNRGLVLQELRRWDEALRSFQRAIELRPDYAEPRWNMSLLHLLRGDYERGWELYEWRWKTEDIAPFVRAFSRPIWLGKEDLAGKTLLVHAEQGLGDIIQFCRYLARVEARNARVIFEAPAALAGLMSSSFPAIRVIAKGAKLPEFDFHCPLASLPLAFGTTVESVPSRSGYLRVDALRERQWRQRLGETTRPRIGIAWAGNPDQRNDHNRSMEFSRLEPLFDLDLEWHCLHKDLRVGDKDAVARFPGMRLWGGELHDFADTAALIGALDVVISVDTSVAHLTCALGKPTWMLLSSFTDYRWPLDRDESPWYSTARVFRQPRIGDWDAVIEKVCAELRGQPFPA